MVFQLAYLCEGQINSQVIYNNWIFSACLPSHCLFEYISCTLGSFRKGWIKVREISGDLILNRVCAWVMRWSQWWSLTWRQYGYFNRSHEPISDNRHVSQSLGHLDGSEDYPRHGHGYWRGHWSLPQRFHDSCILRKPWKKHIVFYNNITFCSGYRAKCLTIVHLAFQAVEELSAMEIHSMLIQMKINAQFKPILCIVLCIYCTFALVWWNVVHSGPEETFSSNVLYMLYERMTIKTHLKC